ncbi:MAG: cytochrome ubiquinol oxidase subunit I [Actinomycetota bacterium]|nr:cytochrome ubiquinol oxidase subunit I [Actinomycetota bacterium]
MFDTLLAQADNFTPARTQMALSLGWHIVIACFGIAFPVVIFIAHWRGIRRRDPVALGLARRWAKVAAVLFAVGAVSGTVLSFEMAMLWPGMMEPYGDVIGLPFTLEGVAFFAEAIFLGIYLYGWDRLPARLHALMLLPIGLAGIVGTWCIITVNAWMQSPTGFELGPDGEVTNVDPWAPFVSEAAITQSVHMFLAAFLVVGFGTASVYAVGWLRGRHDRHHRLGFLIPFTVAAIVAPLQAMSGHTSAVFVGEDQPAKLAAMELLTETEDGAPLSLGGVLIDGERRYSVEIPNGLSILLHGDPDATVTGLDAVPEDEQPPANLVHWSFDIMVGIGTGFIALGAWALVRRLRGRPVLDQPWLVRATVLAGPAAAVALEAGWIVTEVGRQPWIVQGILRSEDAVTTADGVWASLIVLTVVYGVLTVGTAGVLRTMARRWREGASGHDIPVPYDPSTASALDRAGDVSTDEPAEVGR